LTLCPRYVVIISSDKKGRCPHAIAWGSPLLERSAGGRQADQALLSSFPRPRCLMHVQHPSRVHVSPPSLLPGLTTARALPWRRRRHERVCSQRGGNHPCVAKQTTMKNPGRLHARPPARAGNRAGPILISLDAGSSIRRSPERAELALVHGARRALQCRANAGASRKAGREETYTHGGRGGHGLPHRHAPELLQPRTRQQHSTWTLG
jgi:hypothetical protein